MRYRLYLNDGRRDFLRIGTTLTRCRKSSIVNPPRMLTLQSMHFH
jgi:hypothetical protein